ncbi:MAG: hypothetical protein AAF851_02895 [Myxococcota bacterium]
MAAALSPLIELARRCVREPTGRFRHRWMAPMPAPPDAPDDDGFKRGEYGAGLFHHDATEPGIELLRWPETREACVGSLLCLLDGMLPSGLLPRTLLPHKARDLEPARPVLAAFALRILDSGPEDEAWLVDHDILPRIRRFHDWWFEHMTGVHGLLLAHSARASGFDSDLLTAHLPTATVATPDLNVSMVKDLQARASLEARLGEDPQPTRAQAESLRELLELLWDEEAGLYGGLGHSHGSARLDADRVRSHGLGTGAPLESWVGLLPLSLTRRADRRDRLLARLMDPNDFLAPGGVRTVSSKSPYFNQAPRVLLYDHQRGHRGPVSNWQGPIWLLSNHDIGAAAREAGRNDIARILAERSIALLQEGYDRQGSFFECYDDQGRGLWPPNGRFASFNVLALEMARWLKAPSDADGPTSPPST